LQIARICNTYLTINKIIQNKNIFHLFKQVFLNKYLERSVQIFNFKEDPLGIKHTLAGEIDKEIDNFFILPPQDKLSHIPIVFSCDANYFSYLTVVLQSIKEKSSENYNYDIYILHNKLDKSLTQKLINYIQAENFSIKFVDISRILNLLKSQIQFYTALFFSEATYYRFFIPKIFKEFKKIIYLDTDIIVKQDLNLLYSIDFDKPLAAAKCMIFSQVKQADHRITKLKMKQPENYFQAGVMVYNIQKCLKMDFTQKCLNKLQELKDPPLVDQDVLNAVFEGDIHYISLKWNCLWNVSYRIPNFKILYSKDFLKDYQEAERDPYIIHYCDYFKPWNSPHLPKADIWWHYARQTPFYEEILFKNITQNSLNIIQNSIQGAVERVKAHLSYKLGKEILSVKENKLKVLILPFALILIYVKHKISNLIFKLILISNPNLKSLPLNHYSDYQEALKIQNYLSYKLGNLLIKYPFTFVFRVASVYKEWKKNVKR
ncbi:glycosyltransferase family 8 protein, partial [Campylobacter jejuni]|nr:glycosyltransferase family 8 protein [Campylobacter jejuni]